jgi:DNA-binding transcriptional LysR family regulator
VVLEIAVDANPVDIIAHRFDAGIRGGKRVARDMIAVRITDDLRLVVVASPNYLARHPRPQTPHDLREHNCLRVRFPNGAFLPWQFVVEDKVVEFEVTGTVVTENPEILIRSALDGVGLLYLEEDFLRPLIPAGRLVPVLSRRQNPAPLQASVNFLRANPQGGRPLGQGHGWLARSKREAHGRIVGQSLEAGLAISPDRAGGST